MWTAGVSGSVWPQLLLLQGGALALGSGRPGLGLWISAAGDGRDWTHTDVVAQHNRSVPAAQAFANLLQTTGYVGLSEIDDDVILMAYDRTEGLSTNNNKVGDMTEVYAVRINVSVQVGQAVKAVKSDDDDESRFAASAGRVFTAEEDRLQKIEMQKLIATSPKLQELLAGGLMKDMGRNPVETILQHKDTPEVVELMEIVNPGFAERHGIGQYEGMPLTKHSPMHNEDDAAKMKKIADSPRLRRVLETHPFFARSDYFDPSVDLEADVAKYSDDRELMEVLAILKPEVYAAKSKGKKRRGTKKTRTRLEM